MAQKNALRSVLETLGRGAAAVAKATPPGQFVSKIAQAPLRAPSMGELENAYNQSVGRVSSVVQRSAPVQTFRENMRLLSQPGKSLTTETPAARFLFQKVGGPAPLEGKPTVGKYLAGNFDQTIRALMPISPYIPTITAGLRATPGLLPKLAAAATELTTFNPRIPVRNVLKQGLNIPAGVMGAGITAGLSTGLKYLKGEQITKEDLVSSGLFGFAVGSVMPSPMKGISTNELGMARKTLSQYGFELKDYENPATLKIKFNRFVLANHPDKFRIKNPELYQQKTEEFKSFMDAFNKATSAGVNAGWKLPDIRSWMRNIWSKKPQKTQEMLKIAPPKPEVQNQEAFQKVVDIVKRESGIGAHVFEGPQIRTVLKKAGLQTIPEGTIDTPGFVAQYMRRDPVTNQPIVPRLVVNILPEEKPTVPPPKPVIQQVKQTEALREVKPTQKIAEAARSVPTEVIPELGFAVEKPHALAVSLLNQLGDTTVNSGFQTNFKPNVWAITIQGKPSDDVIRAARSIGLELRERMVTKDPESTLTDVYLPHIGVDEKGITKATAIFNDFAKRYAELKAVGQMQPTLQTQEVQQPQSQAQQSILPVTGEGNVTGEEVARTIERLQEQKTTKGIEGTPLGQEIESTQLKEQMGGGLLESQPKEPAKVTTEAKKPISQPPPEVVNELHTYLSDPTMSFDTFSDMYETYAKKYALPSMEEFLNERNEQLKKELAAGQKEARVGSPAMIPEISQFAPVIRAAVGIWRLHRNKLGYEDIEAITKILAKNPKYGTGFNVDSALEAIRTYANRDIKTMEELAEFAKGLPMPKRGKGMVKITKKETTPTALSLSGTQEGQVTKATMPEIPKPKSQTEKIRGFVKSVLESDVASEEWKKKIIQDIRLYYEPKGMTQSVDEAEMMIREDPQGTLAKVIDVNQRSDALNAAGQILMVEADVNGNYELANQIHDALAEKATLGGRETNIWRLLDKLSPTGRVQYARKIIREIVGKLSKWDQKVNKISHIADAPKIAEDVSREMNNANKEAADVVAKEVSEKFQKLANRLEAEEKSAEELLGKRVVRYVKSLTADPKKKDDPIAMMVNTLYRVALEVLPKKQQVPKDPLELVAQAIKDKKGYRDVWELAQDIVKEKFADKSDALELLDDYFAAYLNRPFSQSQINQVVARRIKDNKIDLAQIVRDYYIEAQHRMGETLATRLSEEAGLKDEDAKMLEQYVVKRFDELTTKKKEQILNTMMQERPKIAQRSFLQKILDLSNLGAFNQKKYFDLIAKRLNIPNVSNEMAQEIYNKTQALQALPSGSEERGKLAREVMDLISDQVPPGVFDIFDSYRYQNLLSNPRTFLLRNPFWNLLEATAFVPTELALETSIDYLRSTLFGKDRQLYASIPAYYKGLINSIPNALEVGRQVWKGEVPIEHPDIRQLKMRAIQKKYPRLTIVPRIMEIGDQSFRLLISQAYSSALQAKGIAKDVADESGAAAALDALLRRKLDVKGDEGRGPLITGLDVLGNALLQAKKAPFWGGVVSGIVPFISTPLQYAEMTLQYTPLFPAFNEIASIATGRKYTYEQKRRHTARAFIGFIAMAIAGAYASRGDTTWSVPDDETERQAWYDAKIKPYSVKIGNAWIPFQLFGPLFLALAIPAAHRHYFVDNKNAMTDTMARKSANMLWGLARAYTDLTFLSSIGDFFSALEGNYDSTFDRWIANQISQISPLVGFTRYLSILVDPTYRKSKGFWEGLAKNYPFVTKHPLRTKIFGKEFSFGGLEPYRDLRGEESRRNFSSYFLPYDIGIENPEARFLWNQRRLHLQQGALINQLVKQLELPDYIQKGTEKELDYINEHPETAYGTLIRSLKSRFDELGREEFKTYADKEMSSEEKNAMYEDVQVQKQEILNQIDTLWKEVLQGKGEKPDPRNMFDVVEAAEFANDFRDIIKRVEADKPPITATQYLDEIKQLNDRVEKYKRTRQFFDLEAGLGKFSFDRAKAFAQRAGLNPQIAEYDYWTAQEMRERKLYTLSRITDLSGNDMWNTLVSLRKESPGTGNMVLTNELINEFVDEGYMTKSWGNKLKKIQIRMNDAGEIITKLQALGGGGTKLSDLKKISSLIEKRDKAITQALKIRRPSVKIPKITIPKPPKIKLVSVKPLTAPNQKLSLRLPKLKKIKIPGTIRNLVYARRSF